MFARAEVKCLSLFVRKTREANSDGLRHPVNGSFKMLTKHRWRNAFRQLVYACATAQSSDTFPETRPSAEAPDAANHDGRNEERKSTDPCPTVENGSQHPGSLLVFTPLFPLMHGILRFPYQS